MHAFHLLARSNFWVVVSLGIHAFRYLQHITGAELNTDSATLTALKQNKNLSPGDMHLIDIQRDACVDFGYGR